MDIRQQRAEAGVLPSLARGQGDSPGGPSVEGSPKRNNRGTSSGIAGELDGAFDSFGAGVGEKDALLRWARRQQGETFEELRHPLVVEVRSADVKKAIGRVLYRGDNLGMTV